MGELLDVTRDLLIDMPRQRHPSIRNRQGKYDSARMRVRMLVLVQRAQMLEDVPLIL
jgi:hypothetical protein